MADLTANIVTVDRDGDALAANQVAVNAGGDTFDNKGNNRGKIICIVTNGHATDPRTVTVATPDAVDGNAIADKAVTIVAQTSHVFGPWPHGVYNDSQDRVSLTYSDSGADLTIGLFAVQPAQATS